jgi:Na+/H+-translocating membrane pyrophosphatase
MGADLFGSLSECICAALVLSCTSVEGPAGCERELSNLMFPFVLMAVGIFACILVSLVGTNVAWT